MHPAKYHKYHKVWCAHARKILCFFVCLFFPILSTVITVIARSAVLSLFMVCSSVCPCVMPVCRSVISRSSIKEAKYVITQPTPHDSLGTLVSWCRWSFWHWWGHLNGGDKYGWCRTFNRYISETTLNTLTYPLGFLIFLEWMKLEFSNLVRMGKP